MRRSPHDWYTKAQLAKFENRSRSAIDQEVKKYPDRFVLRALDGITVLARIGEKVTRAPAQKKQENLGEYIPPRGFGK